MRLKKIWASVLAGGKNVRFADMVKLIEAFGFHLSRINGSHHIFAYPGVPELVNLQEVGGKAKPYQIGQFLRLVEKYNLRMKEDAGTEEHTA